MPTITIAGRVVGDGAMPLVIAEVGVNHNGDPSSALRLVDAAAEAGADAVKFQTFSADALVTEGAPQATYQRLRAEAASQRAMLEQLELSSDALRACRDRAGERGVLFLSTPFDLAAVRLLVSLEVPAFKIGSGDLTNLVLLRAVAAHGLPILLSTGMATIDELDDVVTDLRGHGDPPLLLLHCTSAYPAPPHSANLEAMAQMRRRYGVPVGYSDHTSGTAVAIAAVAIGASVIEKHLTLDRRLPGPDHAASLEPTEFGMLVAGVREAHAAMGDGIKGPRDEELEMREVARRSLVVTRTLSAGEPLAASDLDAMRPATGISPLQLDEVVGRRAARELRPGTPLQPTDLEPPL